jgi:hypothetical protein
MGEQAQKARLIGMAIGVAAMIITIVVKLVR